MESYIDLKLNPDAEMPLNHLMNGAYSELHKALFDLRSCDIGISFPRFHISLGNVIRLHGNREKLKKLQQKNWLVGMHGCYDMSDILIVPADTQFRVISRIQTSMSQSKLNRLIRRGSISETEIKRYKEKMFTKGLDNPYIELTSGSNGNKYRKFIQFSKLIDVPVLGQFDHFGLSKSATIPWF